MSRYLPCQPFSCYCYTLNCERDTKWIKWLVGVLVVFETVLTVFVFRLIYVYTIKALENPSIIANIDWIIPGGLLVTHLIQVLSQGYFLSRMWLYSRNRTLTLVTSVLMLARSVSLFYIVVAVFKLRTWVALRNDGDIKLVTQLCLSFGVCVDSITAITLVFYLIRSPATFQSTRNVITWIIMFTVNTGVLLVAISLSVLITYLTKPDNLIYGALLVVGGKLYANSLLAALNGRKILSAKMAQPVIMGTFDALELSNFSTLPPPMQQVHIDISQETMSSVSAKDRSNQTKQYGMLWYTQDKDCWRRIAYGAENEVL
ncbi:unnamed protein product [Somion occarium]|uniref:DUF6534 domain-containing protein n=1 Tax=Somion occarium TaxID=3059160 RepID=A0ABP1D9G3_9APHY